MASFAPYNRCNPLRFYSSFSCHLIKMNLSQNFTKCIVRKKVQFLTYLFSKRFHINISINCMCKSDADWPFKGNHVFIEVDFVCVPFDSIDRTHQRKNRCSPVSEKARRPLERGPICRTRRSGATKLEGEKAGV